MTPIRKIGCCLILLMFGLLGCEDVNQPSVDIPLPDQMLANLVVMPRGITMAISDTVQLEVSGFNVYGDPIRQLDNSSSSVSPIRFRSADTSRLWITENGRLWARNSSSSLIRVFASWQYRGVTKADTVYVKITATRPEKAVNSLSIQPTNGDSAILAYGAQKIIQVRAYAADSTLIPGVYAYLDSDRRRKRILNDMDPSNSRLTVGQKGKFWIYAHSLVYGTLLQDSLEWTGTNPTTLLINDENGLADNGKTLDAKYLAPCGSITVRNNSTSLLSRYPRTIFVELDDSSHIGICKTGDVMQNYGEIEAGQSVVRVFPRAGEFGVKVYELGSPNKLLYIQKIIVE